MTQRSHLLAAIFDARGRLKFTGTRINRLTDELYQEIVANLSYYSDVHGMKDDSLPTKEMVRLFLRHFARSGNIEPGKPTGRKRIPDNIRERLRELTISNHSLQQALPIIQNETGVLLNKSTAARILREMVRSNRAARQIGG